MAKRIVIFGANGFVGGEFAKQLTERGDTVISVSRTGEPLETKDWYDKVDWKVGNALTKGFWSNYVKDTDVVIDTIGTYQEDPDEGLTFEKVNYQSALNVADAVAENKVPVMVYFSVDDIPGASKRYIQTKRDAEDELKKYDFRKVLMRPSYMTMDDDKVDSDDDHRALPVNLVVKAAIDAIDNATETVTLGVNDIDKR